MKLNYKKILLMGLFLLFGCDNSNSPFNESEYYDLSTIQIGEVRDLDLFDDMLFVATESRGIYIYEIFSNNLETLYENQEWGIGKDMRSIYYADNVSMLYALDRFGYTYHAYLPHLLDDNPYTGSCSPDSTPDTLLINNCAATQTHATKFSVDKFGDVGPELYILYKHNADNELYTEDSYSSLNFMEYSFNPEASGSMFCEFFTTCEDNALTSIESAVEDVESSLGYDVSDIFYLDDKLYVANPRNDINSFEIYEKNQNSDELEDVVYSLFTYYETDTKVKSIYAINDYVLAGTESGCYITLLEGGGLSDDEDSKLLLAEDYTIYDIYFSENKLILSAGINGIIIYDWDGSSMDINEDMRIHSSYAFTARFINNMYFIATKNGLEIYNIEE